MTNPPTAEEILQANLRVHAEESGLYDALHTEIFNRGEQASIARELDLATVGGPGHALDLGPGTGNLTLKLLARGWAVTAVDLSQPMLDRLVAKAGRQPEGRLAVVCRGVDDYLATVGLLPPLVTMSSFLHQLPAPWQTLERLAAKAPAGGRLYLTHEPTGRTPPAPARLLLLADRAWRNVRHPIQCRRARRIDYSVSDFHAVEGLAPERVASLLARHGFRLEHERLYVSASSPILSRLATRMGGQTSMSMLFCKEG